MNADALAKIHAASFTIAPRPWSAAEFRSLLESPNTYVFTQTGGFALVRIAGPEAELLTIAVDPAFRRQRIAWNLLETMQEFCKSRAVEEIFLEVSTQNDAAKTLYENNGFQLRAMRNDYYDGPNGQKISALVMAKLI